MYSLTLHPPIQIVNPADEPATEAVMVTDPTTGEVHPKTIVIDGQTFVVTRVMPPWTTYVFLARMVLTSPKFGKGRESARNGRILRRLKDARHDAVNAEGLEIGKVLVDESARDAVIRVCNEAEWQNHIAWQIEPFIESFENAERVK